MAFNFKKALAFTLAAAMIVTAAPSASITADAAAKKPTITASKTINAEKTASIKVNTVKKGRFIKITSISKAANVTIKAKINGKNTKLKKNKYYKVTGKSVTLKVTGADAIADYTSTIKVSVFDKSGKKYKVVKPKTLTAKVKVKASEFAITSVVSTVNALASGSKYIRATFSKAIDALDASEVEIVRKSDGQLFSVQKVTLSSNKKSADVELVGDDSAGNVGGGIGAQASINWLKPNVDYIFKITKSGVTGQFEFVIPDVCADATVSSVDAGKKTITTINSSTGNDNTFNIPSSLDVDYQDLLGRTVTIKFDKDNNVTSLDVQSSEKVVYGTFVIDNGTGADDAFIYDAATKTKYYGMKTAAATSVTIHNTVRINRGNDKALTLSQNTGTYESLDNAAYVTDNVLTNVKLVLNTNNTIKAMIVCDKWTDEGANALVSKVVGNTVYAGTSEIDMKDFIVLKDGKDVGVSGITAGDVLFYNTNYKFAEIYNDKKTGSLEAVYNKKFAFGGKTYDIKGKLGNTDPFYKTRYVKENGGLEDVDDDYMNALYAKKGEVAVYFDRAGNPVYLTGATGEVVTSTKTLILTANSKTYTQSLIKYLRLEGWNGTAKETIDIDISKLTKIVDKNGKTYKKGYNSYAKDAAEVKNDNVKGFIEGATVFSTEKGVIAQENGANTVLTAGTDLKKKAYVTLTYDENQVVTGINFEDEGQTLGTTKDDVLKPGLKTVKVGATAYQISDTTPIYTYDTANDIVTVNQYKDSKGTTTVGATVYAYSYDNKNVTAIVVPKDSWTVDDDGSTKIEGVIASVAYSAGSTNNMSMISIIAANELNNDDSNAKYFHKYTKFAKDIEKSGDGYSMGDIVTVTVAADGETVNAVEASTGGSGSEAVFAVVKDGEKKFALDGKNMNFSSKDFTVVAIQDGALKSIDWATLKSLAETHKVSYSLLNGTTNLVDTLVVLGAANTSKLAVAEATAVEKVRAISDAVIGVDATTVTTNQVMTAAGYKALKDALDEAKVALDAAEAAGSTTQSTQTNAAYKAAKARIETLGKSIITSVKVSKTDVTTTVAATVATGSVITLRALNAGTVDTGAVWTSLPEKVTFTFADGTTREVSNDIATTSINWAVTADNDFNTSNAASGKSGVLTFTFDPNAGNTAGTIAMNNDWVYDMEAGCKVNVTVKWVA